MFTSLLNIVYKFRSVDPHEIVEHFNNYFENTGNDLSAAIPLVTTDFSSYLTGSLSHPISHPISYKLVCILSNIS